MSKSPILNEDFLKTLTSNITISNKTNGFHKTRTAKYKIQCGGEEGNHIIVIFTTHTTNIIKVCNTNYCIPLEGDSIPNTQEKLLKLIEALGGKSNN